MEGVTGFAEEDEERKEKKSETKSPKIKKQKSEKSPVLFDQKGSSNWFQTGKAQLDKKHRKMKNVNTLTISY